MPTIKIDVKNKIASQLGDEIIVCYNKDYVVEFTFDEEWENENIKTAIFTYNGNSEEVVFEGNSCKIPMMIKATELEIGVYSGDLRTSTSAKVYCYLSALDKKGLPKAPTNDVYAQIMALLNKYIEQGGSGGTDIDLSAYQTKIDERLNGLGKNDIVGAINEVNSKILKGKGEPTTSTVGKLGQFYTDTDSGIVYQCTAVDTETPSYTWVKLIRATDVATNKVFGLVSVGSGLAINNGAIRIALASDADIERFFSSFSAVTTGKIPLAVKAGITKNTLTLTDEEKASAQNWLGLGDVLSRIEALEKK